MKIHYIIPLFFIFFLGNAQNESYYGFIYLKDGTSKSGKIELPRASRDKEIKFNDEDIRTSTLDSIKLNVNDIIFTLVNSTSVRYNRKGKKSKYTNLDYWFLKYNMKVPGDLEMFVTANGISVKDGKLNLIAVGSYPAFDVYVKKKQDTEMVILARVTELDNPWIYHGSVEMIIKYYLNDCSELKQLEGRTYVPLDDIINIYNYNCSKK